MKKGFPKPPASQTGASEKKSLIKDKSIITLFEICPDMMCVISADSGMFLELNPEWENTLGYSKNEMMSKPFREFILPEDKERTSAEVEELSKGKFIIDFRNRIICKDGSVKWLEWRGRASENREIVFAVARDITDRINSENKLRQSDVRISEMFEASPMGIALIDSLTGEIFEANNKFANLIGRTKSELKNVDWMSITHPDDIQEDLDNMALLNSGKIGRFNMRKRYRHKNGRWIWINMTIEPLTVEDKSKPKHLCIVEDITERIRMEEASKEVEERFRKLFELRHIGFAIISPARREWLEMNEEIIKIFGYSKDEIKKATFKDLSHPDDYEGTLKKLTLLHNGDISDFTSETRFRKKSGETLTAIISVGYKKKTFKLPDYYIIAIQDISNLKEAEAGLKASEEKYRTLLENMTEQIVRIDRRHRYLYLNKAALKHFNSELKDLTGKTYKDLGFNEQECNFLEQKFEEVFLSGIVTKLRIRGAGGVGWYEWTIIPEFDTGGNTVSILSIAHDITESQREEQLLKDNSELFFNMFENHNAVKVLIDPDTLDIVEANSAADKFYGYTRGRLKTMNLRDINIIPEEEITNTIKISNTRDENYLERKHKLASGDIRDVEIYSGPVMRGNKKLMFAIIHDVTDRNNAERALRESENELSRLNAEKDRFVSMLAHDLRGPLGIFSSMTELMEEKFSGLSREEIQNLISGMSKTSTKLFNLLEDVLEWSKLQRGLIVFKPEMFFVNRNIGDVIQFAKESADKKKIYFINEIPDDMFVYSDLKMFCSILRNLLSNAVKFTNGGGEISLSAKQINEETAFISVKDNGIGMDKSIIEDLFDISKNTGRTGTEGETSSGMGLILCKEFVEKNGGQLSVESEENIGTVFSFTVRIKKPD